MESRKLPLYIRNFQSSEQHERKAEKASEKNLKKYPELIDYDDSFLKMKAFTKNREKTDVDEIWIVEHWPVYTQGVAGKPEHVLDPGNIPVVQSDRGGQVTYHGPGQLVLYCLLDLHRLGIGIRTMVDKLERAVIALLGQYGITANGKCDARGIYVNGEKICSVGLRVSKGCTYHGLALNINPDLEPFSRINPCGYESLRITSMQQLGILNNTKDETNFSDIAAQLIAHIKQEFGYL